MILGAMTDPHPDAITCPACSRAVEVEALCWCRHPICWPCCNDSAHDWTAPHVCRVVRETSTRPTRSGAITVTGICDCGRVVETHEDSIL